MATRNEDTEEMERVLQFSAREYGKHSGPQSDERERRVFGHDLRVAALRFARAYYAEARELGLIPEYERRQSIAKVEPNGITGVWRGNIELGCENCGARFERHGDGDRCPRIGDS